MKERLLFLSKFYVTLVAFFLVAKPLFMLYNGAVGRCCSVADVAAVLWHGLPLDLATAGYLTALPLLATLVGTWVRLPWVRPVYLAYSAVISLFLSLIFVGDACLYEFWDFKLDATIFNYIDSPRGVAASVSVGYLVAGFSVVLLVAAGLFLALRACSPFFMPRVRRRVAGTLFLLLAGGFLFLGIRGGTGRSTANVGMVYFSTDQFLNHSAVNPAFSLFYSMQKAEDFSSECNFFPEAKRAEIFSSLGYGLTGAPADTLLAVRRPNVLVVIMEGMGAPFVGCLGGRPGTTPHIDRLAREGVLFTRCYANSFRTDRGTVCTLSGYPSFPTTSVMKLPGKSRTLPSIARTLRGAGYATEFLYGGDINFTNMQSYFLSTGYERTHGDTEFTAEERRTHGWGVTDRITFDRLFDMLTRRTDPRPWHVGFLTLASHEPWKVPYNRIPDDERANAMAYLDDCIGRFTERLRRTPLWDNTLIVLIPDHGIPYPDTLAESNPERWHIPMVWTGGAVKGPRVVSKICNQTDLPATLLAQMGLPHAEFRFSRNVTSSTYRYPFAFHTWGTGFGFIDDTGHTTFDLTAGRTLSDSPSPSPLRLERGKALLQTCYDDLGAR